MLEFLKRLSMRIDEEPASIYSNDDAITHHYQPELIDQLKHEHQRLLDLHAEIRSALELANYAAVIDKLSELRTTLQAHLLIENVGLYSYLEHKMAESSANTDVTRRFHREMDTIGIAAMEFISKYQSTGLSHELAPTFAREFALIERILNSRIEKEEIILYPLYLP